MPTIIIGAVLLIYAVFVVRKRVKQIKEGNYCGCGCSGCEASCGKEKKNL